MLDKELKKSNYLEERDSVWQLKSMPTEWFRPTFILNYSVLTPKFDETFREWLSNSVLQGTAISVE